MKAGLEIGCGVADITPEVGTVLSGFICRENKPSEKIDAPLNVRVLAVRWEKEVHFLVDYELLGISEPLEQQILAALERSLAPDFSRHRCVLVAVHTHSGPPTTPLEGEAAPDPAYWRLVSDRTVEAAGTALGGLKPASLCVASLRIPGFTYNRRAVLADGRVSMALEPYAPVLERGPVDDTLTALVWKDKAGNNIASALHFACHGVAVCSQAIGGDIPGELSRRVAEMFDAPCLFLQGATGDVNPVTTSAGRPEMLAWVEDFMEHLKDLPDMLRPLPWTPFRVASTELPLEYQPLPARAEVERNIRGFERIAEGDVESPAVRDTIRLIGNIINVRPGERLDAAKAAFTATVLAGAERRTLAAMDGKQPFALCPLRVSLWRMGQAGLAFVAAELFAMTGFRIRALGQNMALLPVTYAAPIVGYLPDREAMRKGGYEVDCAWRFHGRPAPFTPDCEKRLVRTVESLAAQV